MMVKNGNIIEENREFFNISVEGKCKSKLNLANPILNEEALPFTPGTASPNHGAR